MSLLFLSKYRIAKPMHNVNREYMCSYDLKWKEKLGFAKGNSKNRRNSIIREPCKGLATPWRLSREKSFERAVFMERT